MIDWNIQARAHACQACGQVFADKQPYHTLLFDQKGGYERQDVCAGCWEAQYSQGAADRKGFISHWQGVFSVPPPARPDPILKETAESLLRRIVEQNDPRHAAASYILAVMLERKRVLRVQTETWREGRRTFVYEHGKSGDLFTIPDPHLQLQQLAAVQCEVAGLLERGLHPPTAASSDAGGGGEREGAGTAAGSPACAGGDTAGPLASAPEQA
jgi:hypothetical protein